MRPGSSDRVWFDIRWGIRNALILTGLAFVPAALAFVIQWLGDGAPPEPPKNTSWLALVGIYGSIAIVCGATVGLLRHHLKTARGSALVGMLVGMIGMQILLWGVIDSVRSRLLAAGLGALAGGFLGLFMFRRHQHYKELGQ